MVAKEGEDSSFHVDPVFEGPRHVPLIGKEQKLVLLLRLDERIDQSGRVTKVNVFIDQAMHQHQLAA